MLDETDHFSYSHRLSPEFLEAQARAIGCPIFTRAASWTTYEEKFIQLLGCLTITVVLWGENESKLNWKDNMGYLALTIETLENG
ncbi:hypothetical protein [Ureibacillus thermosphaericus]|uniref:hypothetical protein n=1 Tax=Ureibacillus thermosphaericus TaxID=51173 RepID=UPI0018D5A793